MRILRNGEHRRVAWKNGLGVTYEVAKDAEEFGWRLSFAEVVEAGAFSGFPGVDRVITVVVGEELRLTVDGEVTVLRPFEPFAFAGEAEVYAETVVPTVDFNVMTRRGRYRAEVVCRRVVPGETLEGIVAVFNGLLNVGSVELGPRDVVVDPRGPVQGDAVVAVVTISEY